MIDSQSIKKDQPHCRSISLFWSPSTPVDYDCDGRFDAFDNCVMTTNAMQGDNDKDGVGDACDACMGYWNTWKEDWDGDGVIDCADATPFGASHTARTQLQVALKPPLKLSEWNLYGRSSQGLIAVVRTDTNIYRGSDTASRLTPNTTHFTRILRSKSYLLKDHQGNVRVTISDLKQCDPATPGTTPFTVDMQGYNNYYPFGMMQIDRNFNKDTVRYGYNGKEKDDEVSGSGNEYDYGFRIYNPRVARFLSVDPLAPKYPWYTPYQYAGNMPIRYIDADGLEPAEAEPEAEPEGFEKIEEDDNLVEPPSVDIGPANSGFPRAPRWEPIQLNILGGQIATSYILVTAPRVIVIPKSNDPDLDAPGIDPISGCRKTWDDPDYEYIKEEFPNLDQIGEFRELAKVTGYEKHHINQDAVYRHYIAYQRGIACYLSGSTGLSGTEHNLFHVYMENWWDQYRPDGENTPLPPPTNAEVINAVSNAFRSINKSEEWIQDAVSEAELSLRLNGLDIDGEVPRIPGRFFYLPGYVNPRSKK